jgi:hypothetical protein
MIAVFWIGTGFSRLWRLYALTFDDKTADNAIEESVGSRFYDGMGLSVNEVLSVLSDKHGEMNPGSTGSSGQASYNGMNHIIFAIGNSHLNEPKTASFELAYVATRIKVPMILQFGIG